MNFCVLQLENLNISPSLLLTQGPAASVAGLLYFQTVNSYKQLPNYNIIFLHMSGIRLY